MSHGPGARADLLELTPEALTALSNAGYVKRAQKDLAAGLLPRIETDADGTVSAHFDDGVSTRLPVGSTLRDAQCDCPASGMCRHRVMLVLAYQARAAASQPATTPADASGADSAGAAVTDDAADTPWTPARFDDATLAATFAPSVLAQAAQLAAMRPVIAVQAWRGPGAPPAARLPMCSVRFFSRGSLAHARCDCKQGSGCAHVVLAVWAFRQAGALTAGNAERMVELAPRPSASAPASAARALFDAESARTASAAVQSLLLALWLDGSSQPLLGLAARFEAVRAQVQAQGWAWVDDALDECWQLLQAQQARSSRFDGQRLLAVLAQLWARLRAAAHADRPPDGAAAAAAPASQILGIGIKGEVQLDHLRLVSLGATLWSDEQAEGASVLFADPDTQTVTVLKRQWSRAREQGQGAGRAAAQAVLNRRVAGLPLRQLAAGQVVTKTAARRANGLIDIGAGARQTGVLPLSPRSWDDLAAPLKQPSVAGLRDALQQALPDFIGPRQAAASATAHASGALHVLAWDDMQASDCRWDGATQILRASLAQQDDILHLRLPHHAAAPGAVDALARALAQEWGPLRAVAGVAWLQGGQVMMQPLALLTAERGVVPEAETGAQPQALSLLGAHEAPPPLAALLADTLELLTFWLRQGLRQQTASGLTRGTDQARRLRALGLTRCAALLQTVQTDLHAGQRAALVEPLSLLTLLLRDVARTV